MSDNKGIFISVPGGGASSGEGGIPEAPVDGSPYARQSADWVPIVDVTGIPEAPSDGAQYARQSGAWSPVVDAVGILEAPADGTPYMRQDATWIPAPTGGGSGGADGLDHDWTAHSGYMNGWSYRSIKYSRKNGIVSIVCGGVYKTSPDSTTMFAQLPAWAYPSLEIMTGVTSGSNATPATLKITTSGQMSFKYVNAAAGSTEYVFALTYFGAPPVADAPPADDTPPAAL